MKENSAIRQRGVSQLLNETQITYKDYGAKMLQGEAVA